MTWSSCASSASASAETASTSAPRPNLFGKTSRAVAASLASLDVPMFRARQICRWMYQRDVFTFDGMTDLPRELRAELDLGFAIERPSVARTARSHDGTTKYEIRLSDGLAVESVLIEAGKRMTLCLSSQVGCAFRCAFCRTGDMGLRRHMTGEEIVAQVSLVREPSGLSREPMNYVFMGMGEPLHNATEVIRALEVMTEPDGYAISPRRITVSTVGYLPGMEQLSACGIPVKLAISLAAADDRLRDELVPLNRRFPIGAVLAAARAFPRRHGVHVTVAYVLIRGQNDTPEHARRLASLLSPMPVKVNLIPLNPYPGNRFRRPAREDVERFQQILLARGLHASVRQTHGDDALAACGQLATSS